MAQCVDHIESARHSIAKVVLIENVDEAIALLITEAGIKTGDVVGQFFSEFRDIYEHWEELSAWTQSLLLSR